MFWADRIAKEIIASGKYKPYRVDDMFTPSGFAHIGSLRGPFVHDLVYKALLDLGEEVEFTFVFNDFDPLDGIPPGLEHLQEYLGFPLRNAPSPQEGYKNFAEYFSHDFRTNLNRVGINPQFFSSWDMYHEGMFNKEIKDALNNAELIQDIYQRVSGSKKREKGWFPFQVICENCGRLGTTRVYEWDGETVAYSCEPEMVSWARGCGHEGRISPFDGNGKLPWKVDWPAHWRMLGVTIEGAGKDHSSRGGSRDIARELCKDVFKYPEPYNMAYEFFLIGGKKMSSSKGVGLKARGLLEVIPPSVARFLFVRTDYKQAIDFDPVYTMAIPDLFDEYDRAWKASVGKADDNLPRIFELSQVGPIDKNEIFLPRFRDVANYLQLPNLKIEEKFEEEKGTPLTAQELELLGERIKYVKIWLEKYAPDEFRFTMSDSLPHLAKHLTDNQKRFLEEVARLLKEEKNPDELQTDLYDLAKSLGISTKEAFTAIYISLSGKEYGPKAAWFLTQYPKKEVIKRLKEAAESKPEES